MITICLREFKSLFKSVRSIIIISIMLGVTLGFAKLLSKYNAELKDFGLDNAYMAGLLILLLLLGPLFVASLSHDMINRETYSRTMRFLVTKISREKIAIGKFLGVSLFWFMCILLSMLVVIPFAKTFYFAELIEATIFITYFVAMSLFFSTIINKPGLSMFLGIILSIVIPILGFWGAMTKDNIFLKAISYITPYFYVAQEDKAYIYFIPLISLVFLIAGILILRKRDF